MAHFSAAAASIGLLVLAGAARGQTISFGAMTPYSLGGSSSTQEVLLADLNADGKPDIVAANGNTIKVLLGTGSGTFGTASAFGTGPPSPTLYSLALADLNSDGKPDALSVGLTNSVQTALGTGTGGFTAAASYAISGSTLAAVAAADLNADGRPDLVTADDITNVLYVRLNTGSSFGPSVSYPLSSAGLGKIRLVDVNADNRPDILVSGIGGSGVTVLLATGGGVFAAGVRYSSGGTGPFSIGVADFNSDTRMDFVVSNNFSYGAGLLLNTGNGTFGSSTVYQTSGAAQSAARPNDLAVADINGDGLADIVTVHGTGASTGTIGVLPGVGNGTFGNAVDISYGTSGLPAAVAVRDVNNDGRPDIVVAFSSGGVVGVLLNTTPLPTRASLPGATATLAPNPAGAATALRLAGLPAAVARVQATVLDATGREVSWRQLPARQGAAQAELPTAGLAPGLYVVRLAGRDAQGGLVGELPALRLRVE